MAMKKLLIYVALLLTLPQLALKAEDVTPVRVIKPEQPGTEYLQLSATRIRLDVPAGWSRQNTGQRLVLASDDKILQVTIWLLPDLNAALDYDGLVAEVAKIVGPPGIDF